ncbi:MAG TPA: PAS domain S-box protein, partial [Prolixibacteraceae bacterium]
MVVDLRVLFIKDSEIDSGLIIRQFMLAGYIVDFLYAETSDEMRNALLKGSLDLILSDDDNSGLNSLDALAIYREMAFDIPFIVLSNTISVESAVAAIKAGAHDFLMKDDLTRLFPAIERELEEAKMRSEKRLTSVDLMQREKRYQNFFEHDITGNYLSTSEGQLIDFNPAFVRLLSYESDESLLNINIAELFADQVDLNTIIARLKKEAIIESIEHELIRRDGRQIVCIENIKGIFNEAGELDHFLGFMTDITAKKESEKALKESELRYRTLFSEMMEGFALHEIICNEKGQPIDYQFLSVNPAFERITGLTKANLINKTVTEVIPNTEAFWIERYGSVAITSIPMSFEDYSGALDKYYHVVAFCPGKGQFATIVTDITERKKAEELLNRSKGRLIRGESVSKSGNWELHLDTGMITASEGACKLYGLEGESWNLELVKNIALPKYRALLDNALLKLVNDGLPYDIEFKIRNQKTGQIICLESIAEYDSNDRILFGVIQDITDRKKTEDALLKSEENYRLLVENQGEGIGIVDLNEVFVFANPAADQIFGVPKGSMVGRSIFDFIDHEQISVIQKQSGKRANSERSSYELDIKTPAGERRNLLVTAAPQYNNKGALTGTFGVFRDVTTYMKATKALKESEERYRSLFEGSPDAIFLADASTGLIMDTNLAASRLIGKKRAEMVGMSHSELHSYHYRIIMSSNFDKLVNNTREKEDFHFAESIVTNSDGSEIPVEILATSYTLNDRQMVQAVFRDIAKRKKAEKELVNSEKKYRELANSLPVCVYETDLTGNITFVNATT